MPLTFLHAQIPSLTMHDYSFLTIRQIIIDFLQHCILVLACFSSYHYDLTYMTKKKKQQQISLFIYSSQ